jgi:CDP-glycerol glycerophosphotransferase
VRLLIKQLIRKGKTLIKLVVEPFRKMTKDPHFQRAILYTKYYKKLKVKEKTILYETFHGKSMTDSPYAIFKKLVNHPKYRGFQHVWVLNANEEDLNARLFKGKSNVEFVEVHSRAYLKYLTSAKYLINNTTFPTYFQKKQGQIYINTWHGTPLKTLGRDMKGELGQHKNIQRNLLHCDYLLNPNKFTADTLVRSHDLEGLYNGKVVVEGYPRMDLTVQSSGIEVRKRLAQFIEIDLTKKVILYAPTWRGQVHEVNNTEEEIEITVREWLEQIPPDSQLLLKVHPLTYQKIKDNHQLKKICVPNEFDTNELLSAVDLLVTDYSSIFFDFLILKRPIIFYLYDRNTYEEERGLYMDLEKLPGPICVNSEEVLSAILKADTIYEQYQDLYEEMIENYSPYDDGAATERNISIIFEGKPSDRMYQIRNDKINILFYCGGFLNNGITSSAINLFQQLDYSKFNVAIVEKGKFEEVNTQNFMKIHPSVKAFFRAGIMNSTIPEFYLHKYIMRKGLNRKMLHKYIPVDLYKREFSRTFGDVRFDIVVDFSGYVPFWSMQFALGDFKQKCIYQHNDMFAESQKKINGKYKHRAKMNLIFPLYRYFDKVVSVAEHTRDVNLENLKEYITPEKAVYVHNCIDPDKVLNQMNDGEVSTFSRSSFYLVNNTLDGGKLNINGVIMPKKEHLNFVTIGRLSPEKDHKKLIRAFAKITSFYRNIRLFIIGEGILERELIEQTTTLGLRDKVIFTGQLSNPFYLMNQCDCFVLSSNHEGQPMVLLEALILGLPIIATDIAGSRSVLKEGYGELVENSVEGLVHGMKKFMNHQIPKKVFDYHQYNQEAISMFYEEVCSLKGSPKK